MHVRRRLLARALRRFSVLIALIIAATLVPIGTGAAGAQPAAPQSGGGSDPGGNNGTVKVQEVDIDDGHPDNDPHVGCTFDVEWYGFDKGDDIISTVTFEMQAPTASVGLTVDGDQTVFVGGDSASGAGTNSGFDGEETYTLAFDGPPHGVQGYHVKLTIHTPGSRGNDVKHKVFWVTGCDDVPPPGPSIFLDKQVFDDPTDDDNVGTLGETLTYTFTVKNTGDVPLTDVTITDPMFGFVDEPCVATLAVDETATCSFEVAPTHVVTQDDITAKKVENDAEVSGLPPTGPPVTDDDDADIRTVSGDEETSISIEKTADVTVAAPGDEVTYTLRVVNNGEAAAHDVVITDMLPSGTTYVSSSAVCDNAGSTVTCELGTLEPGEDREVTITVRVNPVGNGDTSHNHHLDYTKTEAHIASFDGDTTTATADCPEGYIATDGSVRLDHVDQGAGTFEDVVVLASGATANGRGWTGTIRNDTVGQVQAKVNVVCMTEKTTSGENHSHPVVVAGPVSTSQTFASGRHDVDLTCGAGTYAITPSFAFSSGEGVVTTLRTASGWRFIVDVDDAAQGTFSVRCLSTALGTVSGHSHDLRFEELSDTVSVPAGQVVEKRLTCRGDYKGIVAWADLDPGLVPMGNDPQPVIRVFRFYNPTGSALTARYGLLCVAIRTNGGNQGDSEIKNTASVSTSSPDADSGDNSDSATVSLTATGVDVAPKVSVVSSAGKTKVELELSSSGRKQASFRLLAAGRVKGTSLKSGSTLASSRARLKAGQATVRMVAKGAAGTAIRKGKVTRAKLVITVGKHRTVRTVKLR